MSNSAITWALAQATEKPSDKFILMILANAVRDVPHVSKSTGQTWPAWHAYLSIPSLCQFTQLDRKTIITGLQRLAGRALIERVGNDGQTRQVNVFRLGGNGPKSGTGAPAPASPKSGTTTSPETGTGPETGTVPLSPPTSPAFSGEQSQFFPQPVPKPVHETHRKPIEPKGKTNGEGTPKPKPSRRCPEDFVVTDAMRAWAREKAPGVDVERATDSFRDHEYPRAKSDWPAAWRNWIRNERPQTARTSSQQARDERTRNIQSLCGQRNYSDTAGIPDGTAIDVDAREI